jgi:AraC family transcriptional regulator of adaptative response/methylated-DNA-[protein]-cysteine methyltransferase
MMNAAIKPAGYSSDVERWDAVQRRDPQADGLFYYSVSSTGVYCRPSCGARAALRRNVRFHASCLEAEQAGFRACLRCKPDQPPLAERHAQAVAQACRLIDAAEEAPDLDSLAQACGMSRFHFHRIFKTHTGITPKAYAAAQRARRLQQGLANAPSVTDAIYAAGFNSSGRFYAASSAVLGMSPKAFRAGGSGASIRFAIGACSLGAILVAATDKGICAILMGDDPDLLARDLQDRFPQAELRGAEAEFEATVAKVVGLVESPALGLDLPLDVRGTAFQQRVWQALRAIPSGATVMPSWPRVSAWRRARARLPARVRPIRSRWRFRATGWCGRTVQSPATAGASSARRRCLNAKVVCEAAALGAHRHRAR